MDRKTGDSSQDSEVIRKGPWTMEEDLILINYIANYGEGVWNSLAKSAGLKRTGKSCRFRWLNYLRPNVRRGNITFTPEEQLLIMELHAKWGNRWSILAKHLPGRTDNEIKNYWRTRIQKHMIKHSGNEYQNNNNININEQNSSDHEMSSSNYDNEAICCSTNQVLCSSSADAVVVVDNNNISYQNHPINLQEAAYPPSSCTTLVPLHPDHLHHHQLWQLLEHGEHLVYAFTNWGFIS